MKKTFAFLFFIFSLQSLFAQVWCPAGAKWTYGYSNLGAGGYVEVIYSGDTIVNSINCKKLQKTQYVQNFLQPPTVQYSMGTEITYEQNGVVFIKDNTVFDTLYNFNALIGDHWGMVRKSNMCDSTSLITVLDTGTIIINSIPLKFLSVNLHFASGVTVDHADTIIEKIGFTSSYFIATDYCDGMVDGQQGGNFRCYSDNNFNTYKPHYIQACDFITGINEIIEEEIVTVYPNPTKCNLSINSQVRNLTFALNSIDGRILKEGRVDSNEIKCEELLNGIYILTLKGENDLLKYFKVTKE